MKRTTTAYRRLKDILTKRRDALRRVLNHDLMGLRTGVGIDIGDAVDNAVDGEFNFLSSQLAQSESRELAQIEDALARMNEGRYGLCESCEAQIPLARLQALPYARRCVQCQRAMEDRRVETDQRIDWPDVGDEREETAYTSFADHVFDVR
jgi:DnaK suppressor protein